MHCSPAERSASASPRSHRMPCTLPPRARSGWPRATGASGTEWPFTTAYHTQFPEYLRARFPVPLALGYAAVRWFHGGASRTLVTTTTMQRRLEARGFHNLALWGRGVDTDLFRPRDKGFLDLPRPVFLYFGRLAVEKGVEDFLRLDLPGTKLVVGDGPAAAALQARYPEAVFAGLRQGEDLAAHVAASDVFVFPSRTDTFGLVLLEAMACGVPVAAYPVAGPVDVVVDGVTGVLGEDLRAAALSALRVEPRGMPEARADSIPGPPRRASSWRAWCRCPAPRPPSMPLQ